MTRSLPSLSVVLPAFNEEAVIGLTVKDVAAHLEELGLDHEIIVVDDGSRDHTSQAVDALKKDNKNVQLVIHEKNRGYGEALRSGFNAASKEWILLMDSDGQFDIHDLDPLIPLADTQDMFIGIRAVRADHVGRALSTYLYMRVVKLLTAIPFSDIGCGFKFFRKSAWIAVQPIEAKDHKIFTAEWLMRSTRAGLRIQEIPVKHLPRRAGQQTGARLDVILSTLVELFRLRRRMRA